MKGVTDLESAGLYFKYIVRGKQAGMYDFLDDYSVVKMNELDRERLGDEIIDKLQSYPTTHQPIFNNTSAQLTSDFGDYLQLTSTDDPTLREYLKKKGIKKQELLLELANNPHTQEADKMIELYFTQTKDFENIIYAYTMKLKDTEAKKNRLIARFAEVGTYNPDFYSNADNHKQLKEKVDEYDTELTRLRDLSMEYISKLQEDDKLEWGQRLLTIENMLPPQPDLHEDPFIDDLINDNPIEDSRMLQQLIDAWRTLIQILESLVHTLHNTEEEIKSDYDLLLRIMEFIDRLLPFLAKLSRRDFIQHQENVDDVNSLLDKFNLK
jgi:hypothetical protein